MNCNILQSSSVKKLLYLEIADKHFVQTSQRVLLHLAYKIKKRITF